jgi:hypothetical protein
MPVARARCPRTQGCRRNRHSQKEGGWKKCECGEHECTNARAARTETNSDDPVPWQNYPDCQNSVG